MKRYNCLPGAEGERSNYKSWWRRNPLRCRGSGPQLSKETGGSRECNGQIGRRNKVNVENEDPVCGVYARMNANMHYVLRPVSCTSSE